MITNSIHTCRACDFPLTESCIDLGATPLANRFLSVDDLERAEPFYQLKVYICTNCFLAQIPALVSPEELFTDYHYHSSWADTWVRHCQAYATRMVTELQLDSTHLVVEVASNDGCLLKPFKRLSVRVLGIEPAANVAQLSRDAGVPAVAEFFGENVAQRIRAETGGADLLVANNVLAHVPDLRDFALGLKTLLKPDGRATIEFPHLLNMIQKNQFDTIYHEHFSYLSLLAVEPLLRGAGLAVFDVEELPTHGGSLRLHLAHAARNTEESRALHTMRQKEAAAKLHELETYKAFGNVAAKVKADFVRMLLNLRYQGASIAAYGAPAKGNTLLNFCGVGADIIDFTVDRNPMKQSKYLPGVRIPILGVEAIMERKPDYLVILPWNLADEIRHSMAVIRTWGGKFILPIPSPVIE